MSDLNHNNYAYLYGNTFVDVCEEASRHYRPPYRPIDLMRPPLGQHIYGGHCCCNDYPVRPDPYHKCPADDCTPYDPNCKCGNHGTATIPPINRDDIPNIINIETTLKLSLELTLYGVTEKDDKKVTLETGKCYTVKYITECGLQVITGILTIIDSNIPLTPLRYVGEYNNEYVDTCYIGLDCSTVGKSDRRKIFISSIRDIKEYIEEKPSEDNTNSDDSTSTEEVPKEDTPIDTEEDTKEEIILEERIP